MTEEIKPAAGGEDVVVAGGLVDESIGGIQTAGIVAATTDNVLLVAQFADPDAALLTYQALVDAETSGTLMVEGVVVVRADDGGRIAIQRVTDHSTRTGVKWGVVGGVVLGVLFPPSIIGSAAALGVTGGVLGKLRQLHHKSELEATLAGALARNTSGILVLADLPQAPAAKKTMAKATRVTQVRVDNETAAAIVEASRAAAV